MGTRKISGSWDKRLTVGIDSVDAQHRDILHVLDKLTVQKEGANALESISEALSELGMLLSTHFKHEEIFIKSCGMPKEEVNAHLDQHSHILEQFVTINMEAMSGRHRNLNELAGIVRSWAIDHVVGYDLKLRNYSLNLSTN